MHLISMKQWFINCIYIPITMLVFMRFDILSNTPFNTGILIIILYILKQLRTLSIFVLNINIE